MITENCWSPRDLYRTLELRGKNSLRDAHEQLDSAVRAAYGINAKEDPLAFLLALNGTVAAREAAGQTIMAPGVHLCIEEPRSFVTDDFTIPTTPTA
jgi:hypothetical protein